MSFLQYWRTLLWALFILVITGIPGSYIPGITTFWEWLQPDKIVHVFVFAVLSFLILYDARTQYLHSKQRYMIVIVAVAVTVFFGLLTEVLQHYVFIGRSGNVYDVLADFVGAISGWLLFNWAIQKKLLKNNEPTAK
jgi:VanZ family protein